MRDLKRRLKRIEQQIPRAETLLAAVNAASPDEIRTELQWIAAAKQAHEDKLPLPKPAPRLMQMVHRMPMPEFIRAIDLMKEQNGKASPQQG